MTAAQCGSCSVSCPSGYACVSSASGYVCEPACDQCSGGARCVGNAVQTCVAGCWAPSTLCGVGEVCVVAGLSASCEACAGDPGDLACGDTLPSCDNPTQTVTGTLCDANYYCANGVCLSNEVPLLLDPDDVVVVTAGSRSLLEVALDRSATPYTLTATGEWPGASHLSFQRLGSGWNVTLYSFARRDVDPDGGVEGTLRLALQQGNVVVGSTEIPVDVRCNPDDPLHGSCCADDGGFLGVGVACEPQGSGTWACDATGACVRSCVPRDHQGCYDGDVYWYDSCDEREQYPAIDCHEPEVCIDEGTPLCAVPQGCTGTTFVYYCVGNEGHRRDLSCGLVDPDYLIACQSGQVCVATDTGILCELERPCAHYPGSILCGDECVDPLISRANCGGCGIACGRDEQCLNGECTLIPGCVVVCDSNDDCRDGEVCVNAGDCALSQCEGVNILELNTTVVNALASELVEYGLVVVEYSLSGQRIGFTVSSLAAAPLRNVTITTRFGKVIAQDADHLTVDGVFYEVYEQDPVLLFFLPELTAETSFTVSADHLLDPSYVQHVAVESVTYAGGGDLLGAWNATKEALAIGLNSEFDGNRTMFHLTLNPSKTLGGLTVPLEIPKCMAQYVSEMRLEGKYRVIKDDPLIVWQFDELDAPTTISFSVPKEVDEECKEQLRAMAYAQRIGKPINPWLSILIIPIIGFVLIFFQRFTPDSQSHERLGKGEFLRLAKGQGHSDEEALRQWQEYKRRFS